MHSEQVWYTIVLPLPLARLSTRTHAHTYARTHAPILALPVRLAARLGRGLYPMVIIRDDSGDEENVSPQLPASSMSSRADGECGSSTAADLRSSTSERASPTCMNAIQDRQLRAKVGDST
eukprot:5488140-Pleurochrysis_carterae.AAC.1